jgi:hypothetical protein
VRYSGERRSNCFDLIHFEDLNIFLDSKNCLELLFPTPSPLLIIFSFTLVRLITFGEVIDDIEEGRDKLEIISDEIPSFE